MKCIIIEDEIPAQNIIKSFVKRIPDVEVVSTFQTALDANEFFKTQSVDTLFLDINLPDISGIDFIKTVKNPPKIIITTAYPDFALDSFELDTIVDYLVKPFSFDRFLKAIRKIENQYSNSFSEEKKAVFLNVDKTLHKVFFDDILYIESDRNYITFATEHSKLVLIDALKNWKEKLPSKQFLQIHKSFIINLKKIEKLAGNEVFTGEKRIPIGRTYKQELLRRLKIT